MEALHAASPNRFRAIRQSTAWDPDPEVEDRVPRCQLVDSQFRTGARTLARMGLSLDTTLYFPQLPALADFAQVSQLTIVLNHIGGLIRVGPYGNRDDEILPIWISGIVAVAKCPNVNVELRGVGQPGYGFDWYARTEPVGSEELTVALEPFMNYCIEQFGPERYMFESNFPPDKFPYSYNVLFNAFKRMSKGYSAPERTALFHDTAARVYLVNV